MKTPFFRQLALAAALVLSPLVAIAVEVGAPAPHFSLPNAKGDVVSLDKLRGKVVYVDFWASWCAPCRRSFPFMNEMQQKYGAKGLTIIGINVDKRRPDADKFLGLIPAQFAIVFDDTGATPAAYAAKAMPSSYLIDTRGNVTYIERGFLDESKGHIEERVKALLAGVKS